MNDTIVRLTARQLFGQKRTLFIALLVAIPVLFAILFRLNSENTDAMDWVTNVLFVRVLVGSLLPFVALIFGTAALGTEFEDGTAVYLLSKPVPRWKIVASKLVVAWAATALFVLVASVVSAPIALQGSGVDGSSMVTGFIVAEIVAAFAYCAVFLALSILTAHALLVGLLYVFIWEAVLTRLFSGLKYLSIREYSVALAHWIGAIPNVVIDPQVSGATAAVLLVVISVGSVGLAVRWLARWQIGETA
jgi:ABC-2 type transport system permease protein